MVKARPKRVKAARRKVVRLYMRRKRIHIRPAIGRGRLRTRLYSRRRVSKASRFRGKPLIPGGRTDGIFWCDWRTSQNSLVAAQTNTAAYSTNMTYILNCAYDPEYASVAGDVYNVKAANFGWWSQWYTRFICLMCSVTIYVTCGTWTDDTYSSDPILVGFTMDDVDPTSLTTTSDWLWWKMVKKQFTVFKWLTPLKAGGASCTLKMTYTPKKLWPKEFMDIANYAHTAATSPTKPAFGYIWYCQPGQANTGSLYTPKLTFRSVLNYKYKGLDYQNTNNFAQG